MNVSFLRFASECLGVGLNIEELEGSLVLALVDGILGGLCPSLLVSAAWQVIKVGLDFSIVMSADALLDVTVLLVFCPEMDRHFMDRCGGITFPCIGI